MPYNLVVEVRDGTKGYGDEGVVTKFAVESEYELLWEEEGYDSEAEAIEEGLLEDWGHMTLEVYSPDYNDVGDVDYYLSEDAVNEIPEGLPVFHEDSEGSIVERDAFEKFLLDTVLLIGKSQGVGPEDD